MVSQDNRLLPLSGVERGELDHPLRDMVQPKSSYGASQTEPAHFREYLSVILKRKWLILSLIVIVTSLVAIQMYRMPSVYQATTTILIEPKRPSVLETKGSLVISQDDPAYRQTQFRLLQSPALARQVILTLDLQNNPTFLGDQSSPGIIASLRKIFSRKGSQQAAQTQTPTNELQIVKEADVRDQLTPEQIARLQPYEDTFIGNLTVEPEAGTSLVKLSYKHTNPEMAQKIANAVAEIFIINNFDRETKGTQKASELISRELAELQLKIRQQDEARLNYARNHNLPETTAPGGDIPAARLTKLSQQLLEAEDQRKNLQALYETAKDQNDQNSVPEIIENKRIQSLREKLDALKAQRAELLVTYTENWPAVRKVDEQIKNLEEVLSKAPGEVISSMEARYKAALSRESKVRQDFEAARAVTSQQSLSQIELNILMQKLETDKQYAAMLLQKQRELQIQDSDRTNNISVVNVARPGELVGPPRARNIFIAFLLALAAGVGLAFLLDYLDDSLKSVDDVDRYLHLPALALIPAARSDNPRLRGKGAPSEEVAAPSALALINDIRSPAAEAYRHLRTSLLLSSAGQPPKTILVTSSQPSEGKTTTAVNTAVMLAQTGADVLIMDCDLRRPRVHAHFDVGNAPGLTNYLSGESDLDSVLQSHERLPKLQLLTSGPIPPNPAELLGSNEMRKLLAELSDRFTHIIIDSPPAISFTDASVLSTLVDGVILVVHGGRSSRAVVRRAKQQLTDVGANIFGIVLNNVKLESQDYYYYGGYYSSYYSSEEEAGGDGAQGAGASGPA